MSHARQEKTTSPHRDVSMLLDLSLFWSTQSIFQLVRPNPPCEFAMKLCSMLLAWSAL